MNQILRSIKLNCTCRVHPNVHPKYLKWFPKGKNAARHKSSSQLPRWFSAVHLHGFSAYSLASPIPPAVMANVASFSGISGLEEKKKKKNKALVGFPTLNAVVKESPKCCRCKQPGILQHLHTDVQTVERDRYYQDRKCEIHLLEDDEHKWGEWRRCRKGKDSVCANSHFNFLVPDQTQWSPHAVPLVLFVVTCVCHSLPGKVILIVPAKLSNLTALEFSCQGTTTLTKLFDGLL